MEGASRTCTRLLRLSQEVLDGGKFMMQVMTPLGILKFVKPSKRVVDGTHLVFFPPLLLVFFFFPHSYNNERLASFRSMDVAWRTAPGACTTRNASPMKIYSFFFVCVSYCCCYCFFQSPSRNLPSKSTLVRAAKYMPGGARLRVPF